MTISLSVQPRSDFVFCSSFYCDSGIIRTIEMWMLIVRGLLGGLLQLVLFGSLLLIWLHPGIVPRALQFLGTYGAMLAGSTVWLAVAAPSSLEARLEPAINKKQPVADRVATALIGLAVGGVDGLHPVRRVPTAFVAGAFACRVPLRRGRWLCRFHVHSHGALS